MNRRGFLQNILAAGVAPAVIGSGVLMPVKSLLLPRLYEGQLGVLKGVEFLPHGTPQNFADMVLGQAARQMAAKADDDCVRYRVMHSQWIEEIR